MTAPRKRWVCPTCEVGVLAPSQPRRDDVRRYCLDCSKETGRLVERTCPSLEAKRAAAKETQSAKAKATRAKAAAERAAVKAKVDKHLACRSPLTGEVVDARREIARVWKAARLVEPRLRERPPKIVASRGGGSYAYTWRNEIHLSRGSDWHTICHEVAHFIQAKRGTRVRSDGKRALHDRAFYRGLRDLVERLVPGLTVFASVSRWGYEVDGIISHQVKEACRERAAVTR